MISLAAYDPRPLEPDWVRFGEHDPAEDYGPLEWLISERRWNRELKEYETFEDCGSSIEELFKLLDHIYANGIEVEVEVDATEMGPVEKMPPARECAYYKCKVESYTMMHTRFILSDCEQETTCNDEALYIIEAAIYNREKITVEINQIDPTPDYMEIGSMF
jgi:hypothetical protein